MKRILSFVCLSSFLAVSAFAQADLQPVATVNLIRTEAITMRQLRSEVEKMEKSSKRTLSLEERRQVLDVIINERLAIQAAERDKIMITENEVNQQIQQLKGILAQQLGRQPTDAEYAQAVMNESGLDVNAFRELLRRQMIVQKYLMHKKGDLINSVKRPTEEEIAAEYNLRRTELIRPKTVRFSMIMVSYGADNAARTRASELANRLAREIGTDPSKFDEVAARSVAPNSGYQAGDAGYMYYNAEARNVVGQVFLDTAFSLKQGEVSRLIEGVNGFQIIKITENYGEKSLELHDIIQLGTRTTVREHIGQALLSQRQIAILAQASQELITELRAGRTFTVIESNFNW